MVLPGVELKWTLEDATIVQCSNVKNPITFDTLERGMQVLLVSKSATHFLSFNNIISSKTARKYNFVGQSTYRK